RRRVETERFLVRDDRGRHALARVAIAVHDAHAEFRERDEQGKLFGRDLPGAEPGDRFLAVFFLNRLETADEGFESGFPRNRGETAARIPEQWLGRSILRAKRSQRLPAFRAGHPEV